MSFETTQAYVIEDDARYGQFCIDAFKELGYEAIWFSNYMDTIPLQKYLIENPITEGHKVIILLDNRIPMNEHSTDTDAVGLMLCERFKSYGALVVNISADSLEGPYDAQCTKRQIYQKLPEIIQNLFDA